MSFLVFEKEKEGSAKVPSSHRQNMEREQRTKHKENHDQSLISDSSVCYHDRKSNVSRQPVTGCFGLK